MQMKTTFEYKGFVIDLVENTRQHGADRVTNFSWIVRHYGKDVACGRVSDKAAAAEEAQKACDDHLAEPFRYNINLMDGGSVITKDGNIWVHRRRMRTTTLRSWQMARRSPFSLRWGQDCFVRRSMNGGRKVNRRSLCRTRPTSSINHTSFCSM